MLVTDWRRATFAAHAAEVGRALRAAPDPHTLIHGRVQGVDAVAAVVAGHEWGTEQSGSDSAGIWDYTRRARAAGIEVHTYRIGGAR